MFKQRNIVISFLLFFTVLNLIQSFFTEIANDEAYYWMFSQKLDWGYFDHPPMIAILVGAGYSLFHNELGVRFLTVFMMIASIWVMWLLLPEKFREGKKSQLIFVAIISASPLLHIYSFVTTPDVPLIFFSVLFLYVFKRFLAHEKWQDTLLLGIIMAGMAYSKYHGALVVFFALLANPKILLKGRIYVAGTITAVLLIPHLLWQINHDFVSFAYHFVGRNQDFRWESVYMYPVNVWLVLNPFLVPMLFYHIPKIKAADAFERTLKYLFWGFLIFFAFSALKSHVEPHWIAIVTVPSIYFLSKVFAEKRYKYLMGVSIFTLTLLLVARVVLMLPLNLPTEFHGGKQGAYDMESIAGDMPVAFTNTFRGPSKYKFYTQNDAFCYSSIHYRPTQYDLWNYEERFNGEEVLVTPNYITSNFDSKTMESGKTKYFKKVDPFIFIDKLQISYPDSIASFKNEHEYTYLLTVINPYKWDVNTSFPEQITTVVSFKKGTKVIKKIPVTCSLPSVLKAGESYPVKASFKVNVPPGNYTYGFSFKTSLFLPFINSKRTKVRVE